MERATMHARGSSGRGCHLHRTTEGLACGVGRHYPGDARGPSTPPTAFRQDVTTAHGERA